MQQIYPTSLTPEQYAEQEYHKQVKRPESCPNCQRAQTLEALAITIVILPARPRLCCGFGSGGSGAGTATSLSVACHSLRSRIGRLTRRPLPKDLTAKQRHRSRVGASSSTGTGGDLRRICRRWCNRSAMRLVHCLYGPRFETSGSN